MCDRTVIPDFCSVINVRKSHYKSKVCGINLKEKVNITTLNRLNSLLEFGVLL